jgi:Aspartyl protease
MHDFEPMSQETRLTSFGRNFGFIGVPELAAAGAVIDCADSSMTLHPKGNFHPPKANFELPMLHYSPRSKMLRHFLALFEKEKLEENFLWALPVTIAGKQGVMIVDTGAAVSVITNSFAKRVGMELRKSDFTAVGTDSSQKMNIGTLPDLLLGGQLQLGKVHVVSGDIPTLSDPQARTCLSSAPSASTSADASKHSSIANVASFMPLVDPLNPIDSIPWPWRLQKQSKP